MGTDDPGMPLPVSAKQGAAEAMRRILDQPPVLAEKILRSDTRLTQRWVHGALHAYLPCMADHVIMTYYGAAQIVDWQQGKQRISSRTRPGSITVIPNGHEGQWDIAGAIKVSHVYLTKERLQSSADILAEGKRIELIDRVGFEEPTAARVLELLSQEATLGDGSCRLFVEQAIDLLCTQLITAHSSLGTVRISTPRRGLADWQIKRVTNYMLDHLDQEISLDDLANLLGFSRFYFCTVFRLAIGQTPHEWLTSLRICRAQQLLAQRELPITSIALSVGYQTPSAFTASFRRITGMTPSAFRRSL